MKLTQSLFILGLFLFSQVVLAQPTAKITIKVIDTEGVPVEGAQVGIGFELPTSRGAWETEVNGDVGLTDSDGFYTAEGETSPYISFGVSKEGYYKGGGKFNDFTEVIGILGFRKYQPWNPTVTLVLKKIINPIALYSTKMSAYKKGKKPEIPVLNRFVGFDLAANDWVVPHGLGTHRDLLFKVDVNRAVSKRDYDVTLILNFANPGDGLIKYIPDTSYGESALRLPYHAPTTGYVDELVQRYERDPNIRKPRVSSSKSPDYYTNYFFRVRTVLDDEGKVVDGLYGKIHGQINLHNYTLSRKDHNPFISFDYYLNPNNNDTNIEYDPDKNLFKGVSHRLRVKNP